MRKLRVPPQLRMIDVLYLKLKKEHKPELRLRLTDCTEPSWLHNWKR